MNVWRQLARLTTDQEESETLSLVQPSRLMLSLLFVGCGATTSGGAIGDACDAKNPCGDGAVCDYTVPAPVCIDANADPDGDGLLNAVDHCPNVPGGANDEDGDGVGDECDRCPIAPPTGVPDPDGDDVDSPCDPDPETPGDHILLFDGFHGDTLDTAHWMPDTPSAWQVQGGELVVNLASLPNEDYLKANVSPVPFIAVETSYRVDSLETSAATHIVATFARDTRPVGVAQLECSVVGSDVSGSDAVVLETNQSSTSHGSPIGAFEAARLYRNAASTSGSSVGCVVIGDGMAMGTVQGAITPDALGSVGVGARAVTARFQWILIVGRN